MKKIFVNEVKVEGEPWKAVNAEMQVSEIFKLFEEEKIDMINIVVDVNRPWGADFSAERFFRKFRYDIIEEYVKEAEVKAPTRFETMRRRIFLLTGDDKIPQVNFEIHKEGIYLIFTAVRSEMRVFIDWAGSVIRKPRKSRAMRVIGYSL